jgi:hypothetical protein
MKADDDFERRVEWSIMGKFIHCEFIMIDTRDGIKFAGFSAC